jgi:predicted transcriptional regulator
VTAKELLRERIEELTDRIDEISEDEAADMLFRLDEAFQPEPEPLTDEQRAMIERGMADARAGRLVPQEEVLRRLGITR